MATELSTPQVEHLAAKVKGMTAMSLIDVNLRAALAAELPGLRVSDFHLELAYKEGDKERRESITIGHYTRDDEMSKLMLVAAERGTTLTSLLKVLSAHSK